MPGTHTELEIMDGSALQAGKLHGLWGREHGTIHRRTLLQYWGAVSFKMNNALALPIAC